MSVLNKGWQRLLRRPFFVQEVKACLSSSSSSSSLSYTGRVAVVTGAGGGLGRHYALDLAKRGASVVVNDLSADSVNAVVKEIINAGGKAVGCSANVTDGKVIIDHALKSFGQCDVLINNAGILRDRSFHKMSKEEWKSVIDVHLQGPFSPLLSALLHSYVSASVCLYIWILSMVFPRHRETVTTPSTLLTLLIYQYHCYSSLGTFELCHAVWPLMRDRGYGRIVNVTSGAGLFGNFGQANYSSAKMGIVGLTSSLAHEGQNVGITANCIAPIAASQMTASLLPSEFLELLDPSHVTAMVSYLAHESASNVNGQVFEVGGGWYARIRWERSLGVSLGTKDKIAQAEDIAVNFDAICDFKNAAHPTTLSDSLKAMMAASLKSQGKAVGEIKFSPQKK